MPQPASRPAKTRSPSLDAVDAPWRLFLAVALPQEVRALVADLTAELAMEGWPVRWTAPDAAHVTLHFLGETEPERAELLRLALPEVVAAHAPFALRTAALGVFPNFRRPRVLWLGLHGPVHRLETLQSDIGARLGALGFAGGDEQSHPHITLGRVRNRDSEQVRLRALPDLVKRRFVDPATGAARGPEPIPVPVTDVRLMRSHLGREGARYETVSVFPLGEARSAAE
jgi:2'-5' RNA ligase